MLYYSNKARKSAIEEIKKLKIKVNEIPGNILDYYDIGQLIGFLFLLEKEIEKENKRVREEK